MYIFKITMPDEKCSSNNNNFSYSTQKIMSRSFEINQMKDLHLDLLSYIRNSFS